MGYINKEDYREIGNDGDEMTKKDWIQGILFITFLFSLQIIYYYLTN